jgi:hypothetical protein
VPIIFRLGNIRSGNIRSGKKCNPIFSYLNIYFLSVFQHICDNLGILIPTMAFDINLMLATPNAVNNADVYCGTYLNALAGMIAGGVVTCELLITYRKSAVS